jgi:hypothetical protein
LVAQLVLSFPIIQEDKGVSKKVYLVTIILLAALAAGCSNTNEATDNSNNANTATTAEAAPTTRPAPDNSEVMTMIDANGVKTETRTFRNNPRISKVVVTTRNGVKTGKAVAPSGEERDLDANEVEEALEATGEKIAAAAGFVAENAAPVANEAADKAEDVKDETVSGAKKVGNEVGDKAEDVKDQTVSGTKNVARKTASGAKKAVKKIIP